MQDPIFENAPVGSIVVTSAASVFYNCVAWALANQADVIWPDEDEQWGWPPAVERSEKVETVEAFFRLVGFQKCDADTTFHDGVEKIALYAKQGLVKHVARQFPAGEHKGQWTSKFGSEADVRHETAQAIEGNAYGTIASVMYRIYNGHPPQLPALHPPRARLVSPTGKPLVR